MRYSRSRKILTAIISISCFIFITIAIIKGIDFAKNANGSEEKVVVKTNTTKIDNKNKVSVKATTKEETKEIKNETKKEKQVTVEKQDNSSKETKTVEEEDIALDEKLVGKYKIKELSIGNKEYTEKEINTYIKEGYSMNLEIKESGLATLKVLSFNKMYALDDNYFDDGVNKIAYSKNKNRIRIQIDNANMLFEKE